MKAREAAYKALLSALREEGYIASYLKKWQRSDSPSERDFRFAQELSFGTMRRQKTLDNYARQLVDTLKLKRKERALLYMALYQALMMEKVPLHAVVNETVGLAKKECHSRFANFLNAALKKIPDTPFTLPAQNDPNSLSIRYSYTEFFVKELLKDYGLKNTIDILEAGNAPGKTMGRIRNNLEELAAVLENPFRVVLIDHPSTYKDSPNIYIQNVTPIFLMGELSKKTSVKPKKILDLCASPGGKALLLHDLYPEAELNVNDISSTKISRIQENFQKYGVKAHYFTTLGEEFSSPFLYDLILLDVPCSNSGVLNKRPEARWRINSCSVKKLAMLQKKLLAHALKLLAPGGEIWYMTCSILECENKSLIEDLRLWEKSIFHKVILPDKKGWDGGFACSIKP